MKVHHLHLRKSNFPCNRCRSKVTAFYWAIIYLIGVLLLPGHAYAQDIFIGMVVEDGSDLILERCSTGKPRYRLLVTEGSDDPLAQVRSKKGLVQAQIFGYYRAEGDGHALDVIGVDGVQFGKTCHLVEAVEAYFSEIAGHVSAQKAGADSWEALEAGTLATADTETIGSGDYGYRFVLLEPHTGKPATDTDYALSTNSKTDYTLPLVADEKKVYQGRTDHLGRTPVFRLPVRLPDSAFDLRERFGSGPYGETFRLLDHNDNMLSDMKYHLMICSNPPRTFQGYTYPNGETVYTATETPINVQLRTLSEITDTLPTSCDNENSEDRDHPLLPTTNGSNDR